MRNRYLLLVPTVCGQDRPSDMILSASEDLESLKNAVGRHRAPRQSSRLVFRGVKRDAIEAQIFDVFELRLVASYHAMLGRWKDHLDPAKAEIIPTEPSTTPAGAKSAAA